MKASVLYGNKDIRYVDFEEPVIEPGNVKIKVMISGICGSDEVRVLKNQAKFYPIILGHEFSGVVTEIGEGVNKIKVGDKVAGIPLIPCTKCPDCQEGNYALCKHYNFVGSRRHGSFAEYIVLPEENVFKLSEDVSFEQGALFEPATVALHGIYQNNFQGNSKVAILGGGTIGLFVLQLVKLMGANEVVVFGRNEKKLKIAQKLGATACISTVNENYVEEALALTNNEGFNYVFETAGSNDLFKVALRLVGNKGNICYIGTPKSPVTFTVAELENLNRKECNLTGSWMSYSKDFPGKEWQNINDYFASGDLKFEPDVIYKTIDLSELGEAFNEIDDKGPQGKVLVKCYVDKK